MIDVLSTPHLFHDDGEVLVMIPCRLKATDARIGVHLRSLQTDFEGISKGALQNGSCLLLGIPQGQDLEGSQMAQTTFVAVISIQGQSPPPSSSVSCAQ